VLYYVYGGMKSKAQMREEKRLKAAEAELQAQLDELFTPDEPGGEVQTLPSGVKMFRPGVIAYGIIPEKDNDGS